MHPGPQFQQLDMFRTAHELRHGEVSDQSERHGGDMWAEKLKRVDAGGRPKDGWGRIDDVAGGIREPVEVAHFSDGGQALRNGHHRTAAAYRHNPQSLVPVQHTDRAQQQHESAVWEAKQRRQIAAQPHATARRRRLV